MDRTVNKLPDEVGKKYQVLKGRPFKFVHRKFGLIDLNTASLAQVESLVKAGVSHIVPVDAKKAT